MTTLKFKSRLDLFPDNLYAFYVEVPKDVVSELGLQENKRVLTLYDGKIEKHQALMLWKGIHYLMVNAELRKSLSLLLGDPVQVEITPDESKYGMPMHASLETALDQEGVMQVFEQLSPGKQRNLLFIVDKVKSVDAKIPKALAIAAHLKENGTNLDFKRLNELIKEFNNNAKMTRR